MSILRLEILVHSVFPFMSDCSLVQTLPFTFCFGYAHENKKKKTSYVLGYSSSRIAGIFSDAMTAVFGPKNARVQG